jgi:hypothetical protein
MPPLIAGVGLLFLLGRDLLGGHLARWGIHFISPLGSRWWPKVSWQHPSCFGAPRRPSPRSPKATRRRRSCWGSRLSRFFFRINILWRRNRSSREQCSPGHAPWESSERPSWWPSHRFRTETLPIAVLSQHLQR